MEKPSLVEQLAEQLHDLLRYKGATIHLGKLCLIYSYGSWQVYRLSEESQPVKIVLTQIDDLVKAIERMAAEPYSYL